MSVLNENTIIGASAAGEYEIEQSLRFNDVSAAYLSRTLAVSGSRTTMTISMWAKRGNIGLDTMWLFGTSGNWEGARFWSDDTLYISGPNGSQWTTDAKFRDTSAWYHFVFVFDTTNATESDRLRFYVNGERQTFSSEGALALNQTTTSWNVSGATNTIANQGTSNRHFDGYLAEVNFIDGLALTPDSFGETGDYGEWKPIAYAGTYGTNGFYLPFEQDYAVEGFSTVVYEGNGATQYIGGTGFQPDFTWIKARTDSGKYHQLTDSVRGVTKQLSSNATSAETTDSNRITNFDTDGFSIGNKGDHNANGVDYVAWNWDMGGTTASNTNGSITSSVRANTAYGQSIVSWTGNATNASTIGHGLSSMPTMIIVKSRTTAAPWKVGGSVIQAVYGDGSNNSAFLSLNTTAAADQHTTGFQGNTATTIGVGADSDTNSNGANYVAYCFHDVANYSKFGSYSGTGSSGNAITTGFAPAFVMVKRSSGVGSWGMYDNTRNQSNSVTSALFANLSDAESVETSVEFTSTSFIVNATGTAMNGSGDTYIYMAFADTREYAYWYDQSGNNNDWTSEGGLTESDVMVDSPTNNFCTLNPLKNGGVVVSEGNTKALGIIGTPSILSTIGMASGKWYCEFVTKAQYNTIGIVKDSIASLTNHIGVDANGYGYYDTGALKVNNNTFTAYGSQWTIDDIISITYDADTGALAFYRNGVSEGVAFSGLSGEFFFAWGDTGNNSLPSGVFNFGQDSSFAGNKTPQGNQDSNGIGDFYYQPPSGFLSLCTANLPSVDVIPSEHFNPVIYSGTGNAQSITVGFQPDLVWSKARSAAYSHILEDAIRGAGYRLNSNTTSAEALVSTSIQSFDSDGYTLGTSAGINENAKTFVAWNWKAGGSAVSNTNGSITSSVSANPSAGFSIVSYTGTGGANITIGHALSSKAPEFIMIKNRDGAWNWIGYTETTGLNNYLRLNTTDAQTASSGVWGSPTSTVFQLGPHAFSEYNKNGDDYIAYCFHSVDGYSKVGSYTGNGSTDGPFVHCGFRPAYVMVKRTNSAQDWTLFDNTRNPANATNLYLHPNSSAADGSGIGDGIDLVSNGFKMRHQANVINNSGSPYIFLAFAESPFKHSNAR